MNKEFKLLSVSFINGDYNDAFSRLKKGSFMAVPSGPGLSLIDKDRQYWNALKDADFAIHLMTGHFSNPLNRKLHPGKGSPWSNNSPDGK